MMMKLIVLLWMGSAAVPAWADLRICVRDFSKPTDICALGASTRHVYVVPESNKQGKEVCVATYDDDRCKFSPLEFDHAITASGKIVCVLNYNHPDVLGNFCATQPEYYFYVRDPWLIR